jgi:hypothetical protein
VRPRAHALTVNSQKTYGLIEMPANNTIAPVGLMDVLTGWLKKL